MTTLNNSWVCNKIYQKIHLRPIKAQLGPTWRNLAPTWSQLGPNLAQSGTKMASQRSNLRLKPLGTMAGGGGWGFDIKIANRKLI